MKRTEAEIILNSKSEFHQAPLVRVVVTTGLQEEQITSASQGVGSSPGTRQAGRGRGGRRAQGGTRRRIGD